MKSANFAVCAAIVSLAVSVSFASAATIKFTGVSGEWINPISNYGNDTGIFYHNSNLIYWGRPITSDGSSAYKIDTSIAPSGAMTIDADGMNAAYNIATFTHYNSQISPASDSPYLKSVDLKFTSNVEIVDDNGAVGNFDITSIYSFLHEETPNNGNCYGMPGSSGPLCADHVIFEANPTNAKTFDFEGVRYTFNLAGFKPDGNGLTHATDFWSPECCGNEAILQASITASPVPLPGALALFVPALLGLIGIGRHRAGKRLPC